MIQAGMHPTAEQVAANLRTLEAHSASIEANRQATAANRQASSANRQAIEENKRDIAAGQQATAANQQQIEQNIRDIEQTTDRFMQLSDYDVKANATVKFKVGSSTISTADEKQLQELAQTATGLTGYIIEVVGYADASGDALRNEKLSEDRAKRVIGYLIQQGNVPVRHIVAPGAMGEYQPAASNETKEGRAENRRVEVKVLLNKGIAGS